MLVARYTRIFPSTKNATLFFKTQRTIQNHGKLSTVRMLSLEPKRIHTTSECRMSTVESVRPNMGFVERMLRKSRFLDVQKYKTMFLGYQVYEHVMGQIDYPFFFKYFNMPDTFFSWFLVTELHVWMIMVRYMADENDGKIIRNNAVRAMWEDTTARLEQLGSIRTKIKNEQMQEISHQFNAAIIDYDEGIQSDDKTLAGALWRRFFRLECNNPEHIETLLIYVRKQIYLFDNLSTHEILKKPILKLIDIKSLCKHQK